MWGLAVAVGASLLTATAPMQRAADLRDAIGVNVHVEYTDGDYRDPRAVLACLDYLGIRHVRDAAPNPANQGQGAYALLAGAGVAFDLFVNGEPIAPALKRIAALDHAAPGSVTSVEGPNEVNNLHGFTFAGIADPHRAATAYQDSLYGSAKADADLRRLPVLTFTDYPFTPGRADVENEHPYPAGDRAPGPALRETVRADRTRTPRKPIVFTEIGFSTSQLPTDVSELAQSRLILVSLLSAFQEGVKRVYLYELLDAYPDPTGLEHEKHFGLYRTGYAPKAAARMLREVTRLLEDGSVQSHVFAVRPSAMTLAGGDARVHCLRLQKADGEEVIALWRDLPVYDASTRKDVESAPERLALKLSEGRGAVTVTDPVQLTRGRASSRTVRVDLGADPVFVTVPAS